MNEIRITVIINNAKGPVSGMGQVLFYLLGLFHAFKIL